MSGAADALGERNRAFSRALIGMEAPRVTVETHLPGGLPAFTLVGLPETAVREARDRVKSAIVNCGLRFPQGRVVVNLAPADLAKEGARFDLAIAVSILCATRQVPQQRAASFEFVGELGLFGELRATRGCLCAALALQREGGRRGTRLIVPRVDAPEAGLGPRELMLTASHLNEVVAALRATGTDPLRPPVAAAAAEHAGEPGDAARLEDVHGQHGAKRALVIAAAGGHHLLMVGPPGAGKTMLARRLPGLLPALTDAEAMEVAAVYSAAGLAAPAQGRPPFREPHHSASAPALTGGGPRTVPGEVSLAHHGVLFLDEVPHFKPSVLNLLREPLESGQISLARARSHSRFPARFQLIGAMNPCPAGQVCSEASCRCAPDQVRRYQGRISGALLDRIDLHVAVPPLPRALLLGRAADAARGPRADEQVATARRQQRARQGCLNAELSGGAALARARLDADARRLLERAADRFALSARGAHRVVRVARTVADLGGAPGVTGEHLAEALSYRALDWGGGLGMAAR